MKLVGFTISVKRVKTLESAWNRSSGQSRNVELASSRFSESRKIPGRKTFPLCRRDRAVGLPGACDFQQNTGRRKISCKDRCMDAMEIQCTESVLEKCGRGLRRVASPPIRHTNPVSQFCMVVTPLNL